MEESKLWEEFLIDGYCGLCGNSGQVLVGGKSTRAGKYLPPKHRPCICPNGRVIKERDKQFDYKEDAG